MCNLNLSLWCPNVTVAFRATLRRWSICCLGVSWLLSCGIFLVVYYRWRSRRIWSLLLKGGLRWLGLHLIKELLLVCFRVLFVGISGGSAVLVDSPPWLTLLCRLFLLLLLIVIAFVKGRNSSSMEGIRLALLDLVSRIHPLWRRGI